MPVGPNPFEPPPPDDNAVGSVQVKVSPAAVHKAVRNILANELGVTAAAIEAKVDELVKAHSDEQIRMRVIEYIGKSGYGRQDLHNKVHAAFETRLATIQPVVREVVKELVGEVIRTEVEGVVAATVEAGMEVSIGWRRKVPVTLKDAGHSRHDWIKVDDRLPPDGTKVLVYHGNAYNDGRTVSPASYADDVFQAPGIGGGKLVKVSHWRSLPAPPPHED